MDEPDEILRVVYAQLVRNLHKADIPLQDLFPEDFGEEVYADFPPATQDGKGWSSSLHTYMENLYDNQIVETPESFVDTLPCLYE